MADGSDQRDRQASTYMEGDILVWRMQAPSSEAAAAKAARLTAIAEELNLGTASWAHAGVSAGVFWFDVITGRDVEMPLIDLMFGKPLVY